MAKLEKNSSQQKPNKWLWFVGLWLAGVIALGTIGAIIRMFLS